jgi:uncharacterized protein involved in copper resistance
MLKTLSAVALAIALAPAALDQAPQASADKVAPTQTCAEPMTMAGMDHMKMDHSKTAGMDMSGMNMSGMDHSKMVAMDHSKMMEGCAAPKAGSTSEHQGHSGH